MSQFRRDPVTGEWNIIAEERSNRPYHFNHNAEAEKCPFCVGNEKMTPNEVTRINDKDGWSIRVVPNKFPAVCQKSTEIREEAFYSSCEGTGRHEVIIETPEHNVALHQLDTHGIYQVLTVYQHRFIELSQLEHIKYVQIFKNHGREGGASLPHSHSQVVALPFIPPRIELEIANAQKYFEETGSCVFCDIIAKELQDKKRIVYSNNHFIIAAAYAPRFAYEMLIIPRLHQEAFHNANEEILHELADALKNLFNKMVAVLGEFPYNLVLHTDCYLSSSSTYHWHMELIPRNSHHAGFEIATGSCINTMSPEKAAENLTKKQREIK